MASWPLSSETMSRAPTRETLRFGQFVLDVSAYELRRNAVAFGSSDNRWISSSCLSRAAAS
jgi:hypothetical protein